MMSTFSANILTPITKAISNHSARNAFFISGKAHKYADFGGRIAAIRRAIEASGSQCQIFGLSLHDDLDTYAAIIALWFEGKAYVPLQSSQPLERNMGIIEQVGLDCVIDTAPDSPFTQVRIINPSALASEAFDSRTEEFPENDIAYILFTSGSTGVPKGVPISRGNLAAFIDAFWETGIHISCEDRCLQCFNLTFDVSVQSFLAGLLNGACVYTVEPDSVKYIQAAALIQQHQITFGAMAPSMLAYLKPYFSELDFTCIRQLILTAEACPLSLMEDLQEVAPDIELFDFYGPTEATIYCSYYKLNRNYKNKSLNGIVSIGKPLKNIIGIIIDEKNNELPTGEKGELVISGPQLTNGYWKNSDKNRSSFFTIQGVRYYHTGDLCYIDSDGDIMYSGRIDQQAKIQGFRVELGEIEYHARFFYSLNQENIQVIAIAFENEHKLTELALFIQRKNNNQDDLIKYLKNHIPNYMLPSRYIFLPSFPLNKSEKIDRAALKGMLK